MITQERLKELLDYDSESGLFVWRVSTSNRVKAGQIAGCLCRHHRYVFIRIDDQLLRAHRLAFLWMVGSIPKEIDHINGVRSDNRWENLRKATRTQNNGNRRKQNGANPYKGVFQAPTGRWFAQIGNKGRRFYLGTFDDPELARKAYREAAQSLFGEYYRTE